jgi:putative two-component system response regulator
MDKKQNMQTVLIVDDTPENIKILSEILRPFYLIKVATGGERAIQVANGTTPPDLILLDVMMPLMDGYEVIAQLQEREKTRKIPVIFVTALDRVEDETKGINLGAVDYISKPFNPSVIIARVKTHLYLKEARDVLEDQKSILELKVKERTHDIEEAQRETIIRLALAAESRDTDTGLHIKRIQSYSTFLAEKSGLSHEHSILLGLASTLHDLGKVAIPDNILNKPGKLTASEWDIMKTHSAIGSNNLANSCSDLLNMAATIAVSHHERWDGGGYPLGISGKDIPFAGRVVSLVDVFDALTCARPYKEPWPIEKTVDLIRQGRGSQFDPGLTDIFLENLQGILSIRSEFIKRGTLSLMDSIDDDYPQVMMMDKKSSNPEKFGTKNSSGKILIVDDDVINRDILDKTLQEEGYVTTTAKDGAEAWEILEKDTAGFDAILLDWIMPIMDGMALLKLIKSHDRLNQIPVIMQTSIDSQSRILEGIQAEAFHYLTKPYDSDILLAVVANALSDQNKFNKLICEIRNKNNSFSLLREGSFEFSTMQEGEELAILLAHSCPEPKKVVFGLSALFTNAVEHGNLGLTYHGKSNFLMRSSLEEEIEHRLSLPENSGKTVKVNMQRVDSEIHFQILDDGMGFEWQQYFEFSAERAFDAHGRGIAMSNMISFDRLEYFGKGNEVLAVVEL